MAYTVHNFEQGDVLYAEQLNEMDEQIAANEENISNSVSFDMLAENYSAKKLYSIGDYVIHDNELYTCIYEITAHEGWNPEHWRIANLGDGISDLTRQISDLTAVPVVKETKKNIINNFYGTITSLTVGKKYRIGILVHTTGTYSVHIGTDGQMSAMVDILFENVDFLQDKTKYVIYTPTVEGERFVRLSNNTVSWSIFIGEDISELEQNISELEQNISELDQDVIINACGLDAITLPSDNLVDAKSCKIYDKFLFRDDGSFVRNDNGVCIEFPINLVGNKRYIIKYNPKLYTSGQLTSIPRSCATIEQVSLNTHYDVLSTQYGVSNGDSIVPTQNDSYLIVRLQFNNVVNSTILRQCKEFATSVYVVQEDTIMPAYVENKAYRKLDLSNVESSIDSLETDINLVKQELLEDVTDIETDISFVKQELLEEVIDIETITLTIEAGYYDIKGNLYTDNERRYAIVNDVSVGDEYLLSSFVRPTTIAGILFRNGSTVKSIDKLGTGVGDQFEDYRFSIPENCDNIIVQSADYNYSITLKHIVNTVVTPLFYTKDESDLRYQLKNAANADGYGLRWQIGNNDDLGSRVGKAVGLNATIGVGATNGSSDFDHIYPWSEMKRCNIVTNVNGADIVIYEGETGFALDGTNGDVYVRIPKFTIERKIQDGYEYRIIGVPGAPVHEAFIEDGKVLDEIFIGAFEGVVVNNVLHSYGGVIPTANLSGPQFLTAAKTNDATKCTLYDMRCVDALWSLMAVEFGCRNSNGILGYGYADFYQPVQSGITVYESASNTNAIKVQDASGGPMTNAQKRFMPLHSTMTVCQGDQRTVLGVREILSIVDGDAYTTITFGGDPLTVDTTCFVGSGGCITNFTETCSNALEWHTGRANWINDSRTQNPVRYRWVENPIGSLWHEIPDVTFHNLQAYMCKDMRDYEFGKYNGAYKPYGPVLTENMDNGNKSDITGSNYWVTSLMDDTFAKALAFPKTYDKSLTSVKAFGAYYYLYNGDAVHIVNGGGFDHLYRSNMLTQRAWEINSSYWYLYGARLMRKQISATS